MFDFNEWIKDYNNIEWSSGQYRVLKAIECKDGFTISVQAGANSYSKPRSTIYTGYTMVECGFPNATPEYIMDYANDSSNPTNTYYGFVPVDLVNKLINLHGGVK